MRSVSQRDVQHEKLIPALLEQAKILAENFEKFQEQYGGRWRPTTTTIIMLAESERLNDPANLRYLPSDVNALRHIALMKDATFDQYCEKSKETARPLTLRQIKALREKLEPTKEQKEYNQWRERCQAYRAQQSEEREKVREEIEPASEQIETEQQEEYVPDLQDCSPPFNVTIAVGDYRQHCAKVKFGVESKSLVLSDDRLAIRCGSLYFDEVFHSDEALLLVAPDQIRELADRFNKVALELEQIQKESQPILPSPVAEQVTQASRTDIKRLEIPMDQYLDALWERPQAPKPDGPNFCGCGKRISANKKLCQACNESANVVTVGAQQTRHAHL